MMKRIFGVFIVVVVLILAVGCGDTEAPQPAAKTAPPIQK